MTSETVETKEKINRREFLNLAWLASLGILTVNFAGVTYLFSMPRFKEGDFGGVYTFGSLTNVPQPGAPPENHPKVKLWLSHTEDGLTAIYKVCTHLGCLYNWNSQEGKFICPCHGSEFEIDGTYIRGPAPRSLDRFVIEVVNQDGEVIAQTDIASGAPLPLPDDPRAVIRIDTGKKIIGSAHA